MTISYSGEYFIENNIFLPDNFSIRKATKEKLGGEQKPCCMDNKKDGTMDHCFENAFCRKLNKETRSQLCKHCFMSTFAAGSRVPLTFQSDFLVLEGLCLIRQGENVAFVIRPGDFVIPPRFNPDFPESVATLGDEFKKTMSDSNLLFLTDTTCANFTREHIDEMLNDIDFVKALFDNLSDFCNHSIFYQVLVFHYSAYDAVRYVLNFSKAYNLGDLTHAQIATLTGRNRSTVTQMLHEIALQEPGLLES
ncbi:MAG: hypothetical protein LBK67_08735 [Coriobacteriales bacterium]|nr:hypothetical protein [Coriobacteriales bacterium]